MPAAPALRFPDASFAERFVPVGDGVRLRTLSWVPAGPAASARPVLFVAGWVSAVDGWLDLLRALAPRRPVHYLETREKRSAIFEDGAPLTPSRFTMARMAQDVVAVEAALGLGGRSIVMGSSLGASALLEALKRSRLPAAGAFLVGPTVRFDYPWWGHLIIRLPAPSYHLVREPILFYMRHFKVDARHEPEQMRRYEVTLREAHAARIKLSALGFEGHESWPDLQTIEVPVAVALAHTDGLHDSEDIERLVAALPRSERIACPSNRYMHSAPLAEDVERFAARLER